MFIQRLVEKVLTRNHCDSRVKVNSNKSLDMPKPAKCFECKRSFNLREMRS